MKAYLEIEMPTSCYYCPMTNDGFYICKATSPFRELEDDCEECKPQWCPLVPIQPHGRLIDADKLRAAFPAPEDWRNVNEALHHVTGIWAAIDAAETVLPAEEGEG